MNTNGAVLVGVDGSEPSLHAVRYAAAVAASTRAALRVVHVEPAHLPLPPVRPVDPPLFDDLARSIAESAAAVARVSQPGLTVTAELRRGGTAHQLVASSEDARLLVLGADQPVLGSLWTGRVTTNVTRHATCPVVVVPETWSGPDHRRVVVGWSGPTDCLDVLVHGFMEAARRGSTLTVLHTWKLPLAYDDLVDEGTTQAEVRERVCEEIDSLTEGLREAYPTVAVSVEVEHAYAAQALADASREADLLLVGRGPADRPEHLSTTVRALLHGSSCPMLVYPARHPRAARPRHLAERAAPLPS